jgi:acetoin utilization deacetylase AcuC-like enzyme
VTSVYWCPEYVYMGMETTEKSLWLAADLIVNPVPGVAVIDPYDSVSVDNVIRAAEAVHSEDYVGEALKGVGLGLPSNPEDADRLLGSILASAAGMVSGARAVANGEQRVVSLSSGMHHARYDRSNGFCTLNGLAMAAREMQDIGVEKILILDLDAHRGGGTEDILTRRLGRVGHLDLAVNNFDSYTSTRLNTHADTLPERRSYLARLAWMLGDWVETHGAPEAVIYNAGMDPHQDCPTGGRKGISTSVLREREALVVDWTLSQGASILVGLAGGYVGPKLSEKTLTGLHRSTIEELNAWG